MDFVVDKQKAVEALVYIAQQMPGVGRFHAAKVLYFAEREHVRRYGRPIVGDRYIAMDNGPVPSFSYDVLKGSVSAKDAPLIEGALERADDRYHPAYKAAREPDLTYFSKTDLACLDDAVDHCRNRSFGSISDETHRHPAWDRAPLNGPMSWDDIIEGAEPVVIEEAKTFSAYGVL
jgi:uncharacterized phage-associated protein